MNSLSVSVIIPAYNVESYVAETLQSLQAQTFGDYEAIIVDDGSTDATQNVVKPFLKDSRLQYVRHEQNRGAAEARNTALGVAKGEWIALLDADDIWLPTKLEKQTQLARSDPKANLIYSNILTFRSDGQERQAFKESKLPEGDITANIYSRNCISASSVLVKAHDLMAVGGFTNQKLVEDYDAWLKLAYNGIWAKKCAGPTVRYRIRAGSQISSSLLNLELLVQTLKRALAREDHTTYRKILRKHIKRVSAELAYMHAANLAGVDLIAATNYLTEAWMHQPHRLKWILMALICKTRVGEDLVTNRLRKNLVSWTERG